MPFIEQKRRALIDQYGLAAVTELNTDIQPGDRCYLFYRDMVNAWRAEPRWTTVHNIFRNLMTTDSDDEDDQVARVLAWFVFFHLHVIPYELKKREENGDI